MRFHFKPMPWLTVFSVLGLALLLKLGFWQKARLAWKLDILSRVDAAAEAPPFTSLSDVVSALEAGDAVDYRRFQIAGNTVPGPAYFVYKPIKGGTGWSLHGRVQADGVRLYTATPPISDSQKKDLQTQDVKDVRPALLYGYVRLAPKPATGFGKLIKIQPNTAENRWYAFNQNDLWEDGGTDMRLWLDSRMGTAVDDLPAMRPDIRNNHRDYMLTWFAMAGLLLIFYAMIHHRAGRLGRRE